MNLETFLLIWEHKYYLVDSMETKFAVFQNKIFPSQNVSKLKCVNIEVSKLTKCFQVLPN